MMMATVSHNVAHQGTEYMLCHVAQNMTRAGKVHLLKHFFSSGSHHDCGNTNWKLDHANNTFVALIKNPLSIEILMIIPL